MKKLMLLLIFPLLITGCNTGEVRGPDGEILLTVESHGFGRDSTFYKVMPDGTVIYYSSTSNISGTLKEVNETVGIAVGVARDMIK